MNEMSELHFATGYDPYLQSGLNNKLKITRFIASLPIGCLKATPIHSPGANSVSPMNFTMASLNP